MAQCQHHPTLQRPAVAAYSLQQALSVQTKWPITRSGAALQCCRLQVPTSTAWASGEGGKIIEDDDYDYNVNNCLIYEDRY